jgi:hypothetical protein
VTTRTRAKFRIFGRLEKSTPSYGTVTIDRETGVFSVRPARRQKVYMLPLAVVAEIVVTKAIKAEVAAKRAEKKAKRVQGAKAWEAWGGASKK